MRKLYEIFKVLKVKKRIVSAKTIRGNTVYENFQIFHFQKNYSRKYGIPIKTFLQAKHTFDHISVRYQDVIGPYCI